MTMIELYHFGFSTCSQKVRLVLAEKQIEFVSHEVDILNGAQHDPAYVRLNPNHVVPTLVHDGAVLIESTLINEYLDEAFPEPSLRPREPLRRHALRLWTKLLDEKVHPATAAVTFAIGPRVMILQQPAEVREAEIEAIPDPKERATRRSVVEHGVHAPEFAGALGRMLDLLDRIDAWVAERPWLSGDAYGLADAAVLPYVLRLDHLAMTPLLTAPARPRLADWYERVRARPSFETAIARWAPAPAVAFLRGTGEAVWSDVESIAAATRRR
jgi:glutathione S-transferase